jgi:hypothetical protein
MTRGKQIVALIFSTTIGIVLISQHPIFNVYASKSSPYDSGYNHGCSDAQISNPSDRYINQPEKGPSFHTGEFMSGYNDGLDSCSGGGGSNFQGSDSGGRASFVYASDDNDCKFGPGNCGPGSCYARGVEDGKYNDFGDSFKIDPSKDCDAGEFFPRYYEGFIDGCMSAGKSREICEKFTDK